MSTNQYVIKSAQRTLEVLMQFAAFPHSFGLAELQHSTGLEKNQLYRSLKTLEAAGYLQADGAGRYSVTEMVRGLVPALPAAPGKVTTRARRSRRQQAQAHKAMATD